MDKIKYVEELLERFFEGQTSNTEEQSLYDFFAGNDVPEHLVRYKQVFCYFETVIKEELIEEKAPVIKLKNRRWIAWSAVAAVLLVFIITITQYAFDNKPFDSYEGGYIIRNGVRITDLDIICPELDATVMTFMQEQEKVESLIEKAKREDSLFYNLEKEFQAYHSEILKSIEDENEREEIKRILDIDY